MENDDKNNLNEHAVHPQRTKLPKSRILIFSAILAGIIVAGGIRTPNTTGGGGMKMILMLFLMVVFKATIEFFWTRRLKKRDEKQNDKPLP